jgi:hypothetical protein
MHGCIGIRIVAYDIGLIISVVILKSIVLLLATNEGGINEGGWNFLRRFIVLHKA